MIKRDEDEVWEDIESAKDWDFCASLNYRAPLTHSLRNRPEHKQTHILGLISAYFKFNFLDV